MGGSKIIHENDVSLSHINNFIKEVNKKIAYDDYYSIINIDETGLYYDPLINFTLDIKGNKRIEIKTTGREKERITVILGIDLFNRIKMNPFIIFKGTTDICIKGIPKSESYNLSYQKNSWCTEDQFILFLSSLPKDKKILLLYDNFRGHQTPTVKKFIKKNFPLIDVLSLPPNTTSILQPLDVGINKSFKLYIKNQYSEWLIQNFDDYKELPKLAKRDRNNLLVKWILTSWEHIDNSMIKNSFNFCGYDIPIEEKPKWHKYYKI